jgi:formylglycine-generating enzyme required for sulfatase activity
MRGGSWYNDPVYLWSASRLYVPPADRYFYIGFRVVLSPSVGSPQTPEQPANAPVTASSQAPPPAIAPFDAAQARAHQEAWAKHLGIPVETTNSIGQTLVVIPPGRFTMGEGDKTVDVTLTKPFLFGQTEVTQGQWKEVMGTDPWKGQRHSTEGAGMAATHISWDDAYALCKKLTERERASGRIGREQAYRLPTEAEWEFACRAGTTTSWSFGDDESRIGEYAWFGDGWGHYVPIPGGNTANEPHAHAVRLTRPNPFGLYDMHGNVWEWCCDPHENYGNGTVADPGGPSVNLWFSRGGGWTNPATECRTALRVGNNRSLRKYDLGFRIVLTPSGF